jgi:alkylation response protein AidB-like acyl-CoA dehydrogenase
MDFELTEERRVVQTLARDFARERMMPFASVRDEDEIFPVETLWPAAALGFGILRQGRHEASHP